ncbi:endonuclease/exonuclease/phosphatase family protein [Nocardia farcinica]|uniref:endonuclease/exonuclease/phosphatase family protein n=1 Tax=Nocardia farcinica TaxID=37329 RepID=UPI0024557A37|nr:endonuclease/exonuclease/phosphatase family protein [Nocardia farcinica]
MDTKLVRAGAGVLAGLATSAGATGVVLHFARLSWGPVVLAASGAPYLMGCALLGAAVFAGMRHWVGVSAAAVVLAGAVWTQAPLYVARADDGDGPVVTVMQANLLFDGADPGALVELVRDREVAVLTVDELTPGALAALGASGLDELLPHRYVSPGRTAAGTGIWSRFPLSETVEYDGFVLNQLSATATVPGVGPVSVYALHPVPPVYGVRVWADELRRLRQIIGRAPEGRPVIVGGDFNATHDHAQFRALTSGRFEDAAEQAGAGHLVTYPTDKRFPPVVGIDHVLVAGGRALSVQTVDLPGADHRALVARVRLEA